MINFFPKEHITSSSKRKFGICDRPAPAAEKAYIAEKQGQDWIAAVDNYPQIKVNFVPVVLNCAERMEKWTIAVTAFCFIKIQSYLWN